MTDKQFDVLMNSIIQMCIRDSILSLYEVCLIYKLYS